MLAKCNNSPSNIVALIDILILLLIMTSTKASTLLPYECNFVFDGHSETTKSIGRWKVVALLLL